MRPLRPKSTRPNQLFDIAKDLQETDTLTDLRALLQQVRARLNSGNNPCAFANQQGLDFWAP